MVRLKSTDTVATKPTVEPESTCGSPADESDSSLPEDAHLVKNPVPHLLVLYCWSTFHFSAKDVLDGFLICACV